MIGLHERWLRRIKSDLDAGPAQSIVNALIQIDQAQAYAEQDKMDGAAVPRVLRFLNQLRIKALYHCVEKDDKNFGVSFVHFKH